MAGGGAQGRRTPAGGLRSGPTALAELGYPAEDGADVRSLSASDGCGDTASVRTHPRQTPAGHTARQSSKQHTVGEDGPVETFFLRCGAAKSGKLFMAT